MPDSYDSSRSLLEEAIRTARQIVVEDVVYELAFPFDRRSTPSLIFENEHVMRRHDWVGDVVHNDLLQPSANDLFDDIIVACLSKPSHSSVLS